MSILYLIKKRAEERALSAATSGGFRTRARSI